MARAMEYSIDNLMDCCTIYHGLPDGLPHGAPQHGIPHGARREAHGVMKNAIGRTMESVMGYPMGCTIMVFIPWDAMGGAAVCPMRHAASKRT